MNDYSVRGSCRLCASDQLETLLPLPDTPLANEYPQVQEGAFRHHDGFLRPTYSDKPTQDRFPLYLVGCLSCGHVQLPVVVDPKRLFPPTYPYASGTSPVFREHLAELADAVVERVRVGFEGPFLHLDVACNDGTLVQEFVKRGVASFGIDPCAPTEQQFQFYFQDFFTAKWAENKKSEFLAEVAVPGGLTADCITALNVAAHVDDLDDFTRGVATLLEPGGLFVVECAYLPTMVERGIWTTIYHEHVSFHSLAPLVPFFARHGMTLTDAHRIETQGGSIRMFIRNGEGEQSERLRALLAEEQQTDLFGGVRRLAERVEAAGAHIRASAERAGGKLAVYGAPAKLCTLLHATGTVDCIDAVYDDNPNKVGRFVPGSAIPIRSVSELYERRPALVYIAAWNFSDDIKRKHAELGCEWVVSNG